MLSEQEIRERRKAVAKMKFDPTITGKPYFTIEKLQNAILQTIDIILEDERRDDYVSLAGLSTS